MIGCKTATHSHRKKKIQARSNTDSKPPETNKGFPDRSLWAQSGITFIFIYLFQKPLLKGGCVRENLQDLHLLGKKCYIKDYVKKTIIIEHIQNTSSRLKPNHQSATNSNFIKCLWPFCLFLLPPSFVTSCLHWLREYRSGLSSQELRLVR